MVRFVIVLVIFGIIELVVYAMFGDIMKEWVWWFKLPASAPERQNVAMNIIVIAKIVFGFAFFVVLPLGIAVRLTEGLLGALTSSESGDGGDGDGATS